MNRLITFTALALFTLSSTAALADSRYGNRGYDSGRHYSRHDGPNWNVSVNVNHGYNRSRGLKRGQVRRDWYRPLRPRVNYRRHNRNSFNTGLAVGALFTTGLIGNYSAVPYPRQRSSTTVIHNTTNVIRHNRTPVHHGSTVTRCYETGYDRNGNEYRVELDPRECR